MMKKKKNNASHDEQQVAVVPAVAAQADEVVVAQSEENDASQGTRQKGRKKEKAKVKTSTFERGMIILVRLVVGGVFVMSGFVKAIDPWGSVYKFQEYLMALGWESMLGLTVFGAFAIAAVELVMGVMLMTGSCRRVVPFFATLFMLVMTPLTLWLAVTDAVPDCGCFGDFIHMGNWTTFFKNIALLAGTVYLFILNKRVKSVYGPAVQWMVMFLSFGFAVAVSFFGYFTQPLIDFRPYKVGTTLQSGSSSVNDEDYVFIYKKDGVEHEFTIDSVPDEDSGWTYVDRKVNVKAQETATPDSVMSNTLTVWDNGDDISDELLANEQLVLLLIPDMDKVSIAYTFLINELQDYSTQHGVTFVGLTAATEKQIEEWNDISMAHYPLYVAEDTEIKMIARGNPAIVYVRDRRIMWKRTLQSLNPDVVLTGEKQVSQFNDDFVPGDILRNIILIYMGMMLLVLIVNRTHLVFRRSGDSKDKKLDITETPESTASEARDDDNSTNEAPQE